MLSALGYFAAVSTCVAHSATLRDLLDKASDRISTYVVTQQCCVKLVFGSFSVQSQTISLLQGIHWRQYYWMWLR